jgi:TRAP-type C4-dicarboxylate transport system permease small subunit
MSIMVTTNNARSPKRIRRVLQATAAASVLFSSAIFGVIAAQSAHSSAQPSTVAPVTAAAYTVPTSAVATTLTALSSAPSLAKTFTTTSSVTVHARTRAS